MALEIATAASHCRHYAERFQSVVTFHVGHNSVRLVKCRPLFSTTLMNCMIKGSCTDGSPLFKHRLTPAQPGGECVILPATVCRGRKHLMDGCRLFGTQFIKKKRFLVNRQDQDICETGGFLLQPFHIFTSFLELYETVFHMPGEDNQSTEYEPHEKNITSTLKQLLIHSGTHLISLKSTKL